MNKTCITPEHLNAEMRRVNELGREAKIRWNKAITDADQSGRLYICTDLHAKIEEAQREDSRIYATSDMLMELGMQYVELAEANVNRMNAVSDKLEEMGL